MPIVFNLYVSSILYVSTDKLHTVIPFGLVSITSTREVSPVLGERDIMN